MSTRNWITFIIVILGITFCACTSESDKWKDLNEKFLETNKTKDGVVTLKDGLQYKILTQGLGLKPNTSSYAKIVYTGKLIDGTVFDTTMNDTTWVNTASSSYVSYFVTGFQEALTKMNTGSRWEIYIPQSLGYGSDAYGSIPAYSTLIFDVQLLGFQ
ncbi:MAG: FKBP-type peptidyl-prolyl cis-trans isomerase [Bacteroidetes bacterium]|jgi:FKBP-type peptidyl-prolyl cis-trans isomerase FklB|nr:FKBP-type peptidyl-prolyl cis-trans isomerase [Bacteroidota bacterium]